MQILGCMFIMSSLYLIVFLTEDDSGEDNIKMNSDTLGYSFRTLWKLINVNKQMKYLILFFLTYPVKTLKFYSLQWLICLKFKLNLFIFNRLALA